MYSYPDDLIQSYLYQLLSVRLCNGQVMKAFIGCLRGRKSTLLSHRDRKAGLYQNAVKCRNSIDYFNYFPYNYSIIWMSADIAKYFIRG